MAIKVYLKLLVAASQSSQWALIFKKRTCWIEEKVLKIKQTWNSIEVFKRRKC